MSVNLDEWKISVSIGSVHVTLWQPSWMNFHKKNLINFYLHVKPTWPPYHCLLNPTGLVATHLLHDVWSFDKR